MSQLYETPQEQQHEQEAQEPEQRKKREQHNHQQQEQLRQERQGSVQQENGEQQKKHGHKRQEPSTQPKLKQTSSEQNPEQREQPKQKQASSKQNPEQRKQPKQEQQAASKQDSEQPKSTTIINPHDKYFRKALGDVTVAEDFLKQFLPAKVQKSVEWESLEVQNGSFIDAYLKNSACDILYTAKFAEETAYFYILLEHQSQPHKLMPLRILDYTVQILKQHLNQHPHPEDQSKPLLLVYPLVFYTGKEPYYYSNDICTLIRASDEMINDFFLKPFQLIDLKTVNDEEIATRVRAGLVEIVMKYYFVQHRQRLTSLLIAMMRAADVRGASELLKSSLEYILATIDQSYGKPLIQQIVEEVKPETGGEIMTMAEWLRSEGASKEAHEIAARLLDLGIDSASIIKATNLSVTEIEELKNKRVND